MRDVDEVDDSGATEHPVLPYVVLGIIWSLLVGAGLAVWLTKAAAGSDCGSLGSACTAYAMSRTTAGTTGAAVVWMLGLVGLAAVNWTELWRIR